MLSMIVVRPTMMGPDDDDDGEDAAEVGDDCGLFGVLVVGCTTEEGIPPVEAIDGVVDVVVEPPKKDDMKEERPVLGGGNGSEVVVESSEDVDDVRLCFLVRRGPDGLNDCDVPEEGLEVPSVLVEVALEGVIEVVSCVKESIVEVVLPFTMLLMAERGFIPLSLVDDARLRLA